MVSIDIGTYVNCKIILLVIYRVYIAGDIKLQM